MMLGDGWLSVTVQKRKRVNGTYDQVVYQSGFSGDPRGLQAVQEDLLTLFGNIGKATIRTEQTKSPTYGIVGTTSKFSCPVEVTKYFLDLGMPVGRRVETEWLLPDWIVYGNHETKREFLSGFYAAEGEKFSMQTNDKTVHAPKMVITKRAHLRRNLEEIIDQFGHILTDLKLGFNVAYLEKYTSAPTIRAEIIFENSMDNLFRLLDLLDLRYAPDKAEEAKYMRLYYEAKQAELNRLRQAYDEVMAGNEAIRQIARKYGLNENQLYNWKRRKTGVRIPNTFPTYTEFKRSLLSPSTAM